MIRRALLFAVLCSLSSALCAELYKPVRKFELGLELTGGVSNNYWGVGDVLKESVIIDLQKIAHGMPNGGFVIDAMVSERQFLNLSFSDKFRVGFFAGVTATGYVNIPNDLFDLLGDGYEVGQTTDFDISGYGDIFLDAGMSIYTKLFNTYGLTVSPAYVVPLAYVDKAKAHVSFSTTKTGHIKGEASAPLQVYTAVDIQKYVDNEFTSGDVSNDISHALEGGGFDLSLSLERKIFKRFDMGMNTRIPIMPGRLRYQMTENVSAYFVEENVLDDLLGKNKKKTRKMKKTVDDVTYSEISAKQVFRPFKWNVEAAWRPFGEWCVFRPMLGIAVRNPYSSEVIVFPEYALDAKIALLNIVGLHFGTAYEDRIFIQRIGFMLNTHVLQIDVKALLRGADFVNSFKKTGAGVYVGLRLGF